MGTSGSTRLAIGYRVREGARPGRTRPIRQPNRDTINNALKEVKIDNVLVATVTAFRTEASIVITTAEGNTAENLLQHKAI